MRDYANGSRHRWGLKSFRHPLPRIYKPPLAKRRKSGVMAGYAVCLRQGHSSKSRPCPPQTSPTHDQIFQLPEVTLKRAIGARAAGAL
jgi:hypothetical protein